MGYGPAKDFYKMVRPMTVVCKLGIVLGGMYRA